jgi:hypothetical protein
MPQASFAFVVDVHKHIVDTFKTALVVKNYVDARAKVIYDIRCSQKLRASMIEHTEDIACVMYTWFATLLYQRCGISKSGTGRRLRKASRISVVPDMRSMEDSLSPRSTP